MIYLINTLDHTIQTGGNIFNLELISQIKFWGVEVTYLSGKPVAQLLRRIRKNSTILIDSICLNDVTFDWSLLRNYTSIVLLHMAPTESNTMSSDFRMQLRKVEQYVFSNYPVMALGPASVAYVENEYKCKINYLTVPNFKNLDLIKLDYTKVPSKFIAVGSICKDKGTDVLIKSLSTLESKIWTCDFYGSITNHDFFNRCISLVDKFNLNQQITFCNLIPEDTLHKKYCKSDLLIHASLHENSSIAIKDAILIGLPFITTPTGNFKKYTELNAGMISEDFSPIGLSKKINEAIAKYPELIINTKLARDIYKKECASASFGEIKNLLKC